MLPQIIDATPLDLASFSTIRMTAFDPLAPLERFIEPLPRSVHPQVRARRIEDSFRKQFFPSEPSKLHEKVWVKKAAVAGKTVGFAVVLHEPKDWSVRIEEEERAKEGKVKTDKEKMEEEEANEGIDINFLKLFREQNNVAKVDLMGGKEYLYLNWLAVSPEYQGQGIGKSLLRWLSDLSQELALPCLLSATDEGLPLYMKVGFEIVRVDTQTSKTAPGETSNKTWMIKAAR